MPSRRAAETDFYDELGVEQSAPPERIRDTFRALVRLLHPDQQTDPELKAIAERQMRRLNRIYWVLSDPERRREYDLALEEEAGPTIVFNPGSNIDPKRFVTRFLWVGAVLILAGACAWLYFDGEPAPIPVPDRASNYKGAAAPQRTDNQAYAARIDALASDLRNARSERDAARYEVSRLRAALDARTFHPPVLSPESAVPSAPPPAAPVEVKPPAPAPRISAAPSSPQVRPALSKPLGSDPRQYAGFWFFAPTSERNRNLYPPQFIEAVLTERNGVIHGRYRARYRIVDRAISPDVNFEFSAAPIGTTLSSPWTGPGGAKGQVTLSLTGENTLKFDWTATDLGSIQGLASGTAILMRKVD